MELSRKFKIIVNSKECGTCSGSSPSAVAKKVVKKLCGKSNKVVKFSLKECKRGCERVCGPYQGRMEKLDRPYKRSGKTITHRVVCGKVRKMKGGNSYDNLDNFKKKEGDGEFKIMTFDNYYPHVYFGGNDDFFKYLIFFDTYHNQEHIAQINTDHTKISTFYFKDNNDDLKKNLKKLKVYLNNLNDKYHQDSRMKEYLNRLLGTINEKKERNENHEQYLRNRPQNIANNVNND